MVSYKFVTAAALVASASAITINSPTGLTTCEPSAITWSGGTAPYYVTILPGGEVSGTVLETLVSDSSATTYTWNVNIAGGSYVTFAAKDSTGTIAYSASVGIATGSDTSCVNVTDPVTSSVSGATAGSTTVLSSSTSASTKASSTAGSSSGSSSKSGSATTSGTSSAASASSSDSSSAATKIYGSFGIAGVLAALAVVLV